MMIYVLHHFTDVIGVYSSREIAEAATRAVWAGTLDAAGFYIQECTLDRGAPA